MTAGDPALIAFDQAVAAARARLRTSTGRARVLLREACASGEVRAFARLSPPYRVMVPPLAPVPRAMWLDPAAYVDRISDDGLLIGPDGWDRGPVMVDADDLEHWLSRNCAVEPSNSTALAGNARRPPHKLRAVEKVLEKLFGGKIPDQSAMVNKVLCAKVRAELPRDLEISPDTILLAAGRRKRRGQRGK